MIGPTGIKNLFEMMHVIFHVSINNAIVEVDSKESFKIGLENQLSDSLEYHGCIFVPILCRI